MQPTIHERDLVSARLRAALSASGMSAGSFAELLGTSRTRFSTYTSGSTMPSAAFYERALTAGNALARAHQHGWMTPIATTRVVEDALAGGDETWAMRLILQARDHLGQMLDAGDAGADSWLLRGEPISDPRFEALLAGVVEHEFTRRSITRSPQWTTGQRLGTPWVQPSARRGVGWTQQHTPTWLATRNIYISEHDLITA